EEARPRRDIRVCSLLLPDRIDERDELSNIYGFNRAFIGDGELLGHSRMRHFVMGAAAPGWFTHDRMFAAERLDIVNSPVTGWIAAHPLKPIAHAMFPPSAYGVLSYFTLTRRSSTERCAGANPRRDARHQSAAGAAQGPGRAGARRAD